MTNPHILHSNECKRNQHEKDKHTTVSLQLGKMTESKRITLFSIDYKQRHSIKTRLLFEWSSVVVCDVCWSDASQLNHCHARRPHRIVYTTIMFWRNATQTQVTVIMDACWMKRMCMNWCLVFNSFSWFSAMIMRSYVIPTSFVVVGFFCIGRAHSIRRSASRRRFTWFLNT